MSEYNNNNNNYKILRLYDLDLVSNIVLNKIRENRVCEFTFNEECNIYDILNTVLESFLIKLNRTLVISDSIEEIYKHNKIISALKENLYDLTKKYNIEVKLKNQIANLPDNTGKTLLSKIEVLNRRIAKNIDLLNKVTNFFYNKDSEGLSLVDKYYITEKEICNNDENHYYYKIFRIKKPFNNLSYYEIKAIKEEIEKRNLIPVYIKYRRYLDNSRFMILEKNINNMVLEETIKELTQINNTNSIKLECSNIKYKKDFIDNFIINQNMNPVEINELADIVNMKYNGHLLERKVDKSFLSFLSFFRKNKKNYNNENVERYDYIRKDIIRDFNKIYKNINLEIKKWGFLSNVLDEEEYLRFKLMIIKGEDIKEKVALYYKLLQLSKNSESVKNVIETLDSSMKEILEYCYDSIEYKNDLEDIIKNIHKIKLYYDIENMEVRNDDIIIEYKNFNIIKESIYNDIKSRDLLIEEGIKLLWDNLIRETYKVSSLNIDKIDYYNKETIKNTTPIVLSDNIKVFEDDIFSDINSFDKIILFDTNKTLDIEKLKENVQEDKIVIFRKKEKEIIKVKEESDIVDLNKIIEASIRENHINYNLLEDIIAYISINGYIINRNANYKEEIYKLIISKLDSNKKIGIIIDTEVFNYKENYYIKELYSNDIEEDFFVYRIWSRDIWINKNNVLKNLVEYAKEVL